MDEHIRQVKQASETITPDAGATGKPTMMQTGAELMVIMGVAGFIGHMLDGWLDTRPWMLIAFILLGFAAGVMNMYRAATMAEKTAKAKKSTGEKPVLLREKAGE